MSGKAAKGRAERLVCIGLFGEQGAGKSTVATMLERSAQRRQWRCTRLRLADPLYDLQARVYEVCDVAPSDRYQQDSALLADLARHVRRIRPTALTADLARRLDAVRDTSASGSLLVVCEDVRPVDVPDVVTMGFRLVRVAAPPALAASRCRQRGDLSEAPDERRQLAPQIAAIRPDEVIDNDGTLDELITTVDQLLDRLVP